jgi:ribose transport system permease protein
VIGVLLAGGVRRVNGLIVIYGRLQPIVATIATGAVYLRHRLWLRPFPGGSSTDLADALTGRLFGVMPTSLVVLLGVVLLVWVPSAARSRPRRLCRRLVGGRGLHVRRADPARQVHGLCRCRPARAAIGGLFLTFFTYSGEASAPRSATPIR